ncbi:MAG: radical SAM protein [Lachnospiraceae bacterium]|nr:radical SAM protein [Lachnospiraceae bacterium]
MVGEKTEETKRYREIFDTLRLLDKKPKGLRNYTILTTTRCNARCAYCYEAGVLQEPMTPETAEAVAEFILRTRDPEAETLRFMWFGGEPLMGQEVMDISTGRLNQEKVPFISTVITNGYLADDEVVKKAIGPWHVRNVQVTLDGTEEKYNRVKDFIDCEGSAFVRVLSNVRRLCEAKIPLYIRINAAPGDLEDAYRLADYLKAEFGVGFLAGVYVNNLFMTGEEPISYGEPPQSVQTYLEEVETLQKTIRSEGLQDPQWLENKMDEPMAGFKTSLCRASSMASSLVINQAGRLTNCQHCLPGDFFGDVWKGIVKDENWSRINRPPVKEACQDCPMLPSCTNQSAYCPNLLRWCGWDMRRKLRLALDRLWEKEKGWEA